MLHIRQSPTKKHYQLTSIYWLKGSDAEPLCHARDPTKEFIFIVKGNKQIEEECQSIHRDVLEYHLDPKHIAMSESYPLLLYI